MKLTWNLLQGKSTWAQFFLAKYVGNQHISMVHPMKGSKFWKMLLFHLPSVAHFSKWKVREGNVSFWKDKWLTDAPVIAHHPISEVPEILL